MTIRTLAGRGMFVALAALATVATASTAAAAGPAAFGASGVSAASAAKAAGGYVLVPTASGTSGRTYAAAFRYR